VARTRWTGLPKHPSVVLGSTGANEAGALGTGTGGGGGGDDDDDGGV